ncbi:MAG TPA: DUF1634 domain-containing protein [Pirellulales bacterium]|jgi:uncharacterized membrane protein
MATNSQQAPDGPTPSSPTRLARAVHASLLAGSLASALLFLAGLVVVAVTRQPRPNDAPKISVPLISAALHGDGVALLDLGLLVLLLTPLLRIVILAVGWTALRDYRFALVAIFVLALLTVSLVIGLG